jgi:cytochrome c oxidase subunit 2
MDMIPGRVTHLALHPTDVGVFRGACAEYCGASHAWMSLYVEVMPRDDFDRWLAHQASPAAAPTDALAARGGELFLSTGCGACHAVRGTDAKGVIGPDLTHVGGRLSLAAGVLDNEIAAFRRFLVEPEHLKPGVLMPHFAMLPPADIGALAAYLEGLQ